MPSNIQPLVTSEIIYSYNQRALKIVYLAFIACKQFNSHNKTKEGEHISHSQDKIYTQNNLIMM